MPMLCDRCKQREAKIYYTEIVGGKRHEQHLCEECAAELTTFHKDSSLGSILSGLFGSAMSASNLVCPKCNETYAEFRKTGKLGCNKCYETFGGNIENTIKRIQGATEHTGRRPKRYRSEAATEDNPAAEFMQLSEIDQLNIQLKKAVANDEFETAASLRDRIRALKGENV